MVFRVSPTSAIVVHKSSAFDLLSVAYILHDGGEHHVFWNSRTAGTVFPSLKVIMLYVAALCSIPCIGYSTIETWSMLEHGDMLQF